MSVIKYIFIFILFLLITVTFFLVTTNSNLEIPQEEVIIEIDSSDVNN